jgi:hypothetical protein
MNASYLDLRVGGLIRILVTRGVNYPAISFDFDGQDAPEDMIITIEGYDGGNDAVFTNGNGLTVNGSIVLWSLGIVTADSGRYEGTVVTESEIFGMALRFKLYVEVS